MHNNVFYRSGGAGDDHAHGRGGVEERRADRGLEQLDDDRLDQRCPPSLDGHAHRQRSGLHQRHRRRLLARRREPAHRRGQRRPRSAVGLSLSRTRCSLRLPPSRDRRAPSAPRTRARRRRIDIGAYERGSGARPQLSVADVSVTEGNSGATSAVFTVTPGAGRERHGDASTTPPPTARPPPAATMSADLGHAELRCRRQTTKTVTVPVIGDTAVEGNETFYVALGGATNATIADSQAHRHHPQRRRPRWRSRSTT